MFRYLELLKLSRCTVVGLLQDAFGFGFGVGVGVGPVPPGFKRGQGRLSQ